jgi:hypothetical protein
MVASPYYCTGPVAEQTSRQQYVTEKACSPSGSWEAKREPGRSMGHSISFKGVPPPHDLTSFYQALPPNSTPGWEPSLYHMGLCGTLKIHMIASQARYMQKKIVEK